MGISRRTAAKWYTRYREHGWCGLEEMSSRPLTSPTATPDNVVDLVLDIRRSSKWGAARIAAHMNSTLGVEISHSTVQRILHRRGISRVADMDEPTGENKREPKTMVAKYAGYMVHVDVKKVGRIPDGGGWFIHGQGTDLARKSKRKGIGKVGYIYVHSAIEAYSRLAYSEVHLNERGITAAGFWLRTATFLARHGIDKLERNMTDNGSAYRSRAYESALVSTATDHRFTPPYTPRVNGKVERFNQTLKAEWLYVRGYESEDARIAALTDFLNYYNHERPHSALGYKPPASLAPSDFRLEPQPMQWPAVEIPRATSDDYLF